MSTNQLIIKQMVLEDWQSAIALNKRLEELTLPSWSQAIWQRTLASDQHEVWGHVDFSNNWVSLAVLALNVEDAELEMIIVDKTWRRQHLAADLMRHLIQRAQQIHASQLLLEVAATNTAAIALYQKLGFHYQGVRPNYYRLTPELSVDALLWAYPLK